MTTETQDLEQQQTDDEAVDPTQEELDAEAGFDAGFKKVHGGATDDTDKDPEAKVDGDDANATGVTAEKSAAELEAEAKAKTDAEAKQAEEAYLAAMPKSLREKFESVDALSGRMRNVEGNLGGMKSQLTTALATAKAAAEKRGEEAPSKQQIDAALADPAAMDKLMEDFPELVGPVQNELKAIRGEIAKKAGAPVDVESIEKKVAASVGTQVSGEVSAQIEELIPLFVKHPSWKKTVQTPEFHAWHATLTPEAKAKADANADGAIEMLDNFTAHRTAQTAAKESADKERLRREKRMAGGVTPQGTAAAVSTGISDEEAFNRGFKRVAGKKP